MDPRQLSNEDLPLIVFSDHTSGLIEFFIKFRTRGLYNHVMWMARPGFFASQGNTYSEAPLKRYMKPGSRLKFVAVLGLSPTQRGLIYASIGKKLKEPWIKKRYDWLGILGQATGLTWINTPWLEYCSEDVPQHLKYVAKHMSDDSEIAKVIRGIPQHTSPQELMEYCQAHPNVFKTVGKWESDDEAPAARNDGGFLRMRFAC